MIKTFKESVKFLESFIPPPEKKHPGELGFKRMEYLVGLLGNPQLKYPTIHVGGTSGKGSTAMVIAQILATKYTVGLITSPHLERITERIMMRELGSDLKVSKGLTPIPISEFVNLVNEITPYIYKVEKSKYGKPSYFEIIAAMSFLYFVKEKVDIAVVEVGMGGRFDATNIIKPLVAVFTNVGLDHTEVLGDTVEKIALEKAGIIKSGIQVISGVTQPSVIKIVRQVCREKEAHLSLLGRDFHFIIKKISQKGSRFDYIQGSDLKGAKGLTQSITGAKGLTLSDLRLSLLGEHQVENASLALRAIEIIKKLFQGGRTSSEVRPLKGKISERGIREVLKTVFIPGRLEIVQKNPLIVLDGAHNQDKAKALAKAIKKIFPKRAVTAIIAIKNDKNAFGILSELMPICNKVIFTSFYLTSDLGIISSFAPEDLRFRAKKIGKDKNLSIINDPKIAVGEAIKSAEAGDLILVTGSLYLVGEIRRNFQFSI